MEVVEYILDLDLFKSVPNKFRKLLNHWAISFLLLQILQTILFMGSSVMYNKVT